MTDSCNKPDTDELLFTLDQLEQTTEIMGRVVSRLKRQLLQIQQSSGEANFSGSQTPSNSPSLTPPKTDSSPTSKAYSSPSLSEPAAPSTKAPSTPDKTKRILH